MIKTLPYVLSFSVSCHCRYYRLLVDASALYLHEVLSYLPAAFEAIHERHVTVHQYQGIATVDVSGVVLRRLLLLFCALSLGNVVFNYF